MYAIFQTLCQQCFQTLQHSNIAPDRVFIPPRISEHRLPFHAFLPADVLNNYLQDTDDNSDDDDDDVKQMQRQQILDVRRHCFLPVLMYIFRHCYSMSYHWRQSTCGWTSSHVLVLFKWRKRGYYSTRLPIMHSGIALDIAHKWKMYSLQSYKRIGYTWRWYNCTSQWCYEWSSRSGIHNTSASTHTTATWYSALAIGQTRTWHRCCT
jgi:hypothetical protein